MVAPRIRTVIRKQPDDDEYFYGFREYRVVDETGTAQFVRRPLTRLELLHPQENDYEMASSRHAVLLEYLSLVIRWAARRIPGAVVFHDVDVFWDDPQRLNHRPDITVVLAAPEKWNWLSFDVKEEGLRPWLIAEVTSRATHENDLVDKFHQYAHFGVEWYLIVDQAPATPVDPIEIRLHHLEQGSYRELPAKANGWLWVQPLRIWLTSQAGEVECYNEEGQRLLAPVAELEARLASEMALGQTRAELDQVAARADEAIARAAQETARADEATARAAEEAAARRALEAQLAEALARLKAPDSSMS